MQTDDGGAIYKLQKYVSRYMLFSFINPGEQDCKNFLGDSNICVFDPSTWSNMLAP